MSSEHKIVVIWDGDEKNKGNERKRERREDDKTSRGNLKEGRGKEVEVEWAFNVKKGAPCAKDGVCVLAMAVQGRRIGRAQIRC